jgi:peptidoglycan hydrolase CwlO-like protein
MRVGSTKKGVILLAFYDGDAQSVIVKLSNFVQMTKTEKIKQLQHEVQSYSEQVQSNQKTILDQKQLMRNLFRKIDEHQSFIPSRQK